MTLRARLRRIPLLAWIAVPLALAALVAWPLGGWDTVTLVSREVPGFASNQTLHGHRFDLRVDDAWLTDEHPAGYGAPEDGNVFLIVRAEVTNVSDLGESASALEDYIVPPVPGGGDFGTSQFVLATDHTTLPVVNPGLPTLLDILYEIPDDAVAPGDDLAIEMYDSLPRRSFVYSGIVWDEFLAGTAVRTVDRR